MKYTQIEKKWIKSIPPIILKTMPKAEIEKIIKRARKQRLEERRDEFGF
jgi:hypothetical protein